MERYIKRKIRYNLNYGDMKKVCKYCGSTDVVADTFARWDEEKNDWIVDSVYDKGAYCNECDGETTIVNEDEYEPEEDSEGFTINDR